MGTYFSISLFLALLILKSLTLSSCREIPNSTTDELALLTFKNSITNGGLADTWSTNTSMCYWTGVSCGTRHLRVTALNVSGFGLVGTIPPHLGNLTFLRSLDISFNNFSGLVPLELSNLRRLTYINMGFNNFTGGIPAWFEKVEFMNLNNNSFSGRIPASLFNVSSLVEINLRFNQLSGELSNDDICRNTPKLKALYLSGNQIAGEIPANIHRCRELVDLRLATNQFNGSIPTEIGSLAMLTTLNLRSNKLQGSIPEQFGNLASLETLNLQSNYLTDPLTEQFGSMSSLVILDISSNRLTGSIPEQFGNLTSLETLHLESNYYLTGPIPKQLGNMTSLKSLDLSSNRLSGELPEELGNLAHLEIFGAAFNELNGSIPSSIFNISTLKRLGLQQNQFSGSLPPNMGLSLPNLQGLFLFFNKLSGQIPSSINNASQLTIIELNRNSFTGPIPDLGDLRLLRSLRLWENNLTGADSPTQELTFLSSLTNCPYLEFIEFTDNPLMLGILPASVGNLSTSLKTFMASTCDIRGPVPPEIGNLTSLLLLHLSENQLTGFIPPALGKLKNLQRLHLGDNRLQGDIPHVLCQLNNLGELNLSSNMLTGQLHECFGQLTSLRDVSFASNNLSSIIPSEFWDLTDLVTLDLHSNNFSGEISSQIGNLKAMGQLDMSSNQFSGKIPNSLGDCQSLEFLSLSNNNLSGSIPVSFESLLALQFFNVSNNKLEGEIPNGGRFANFTAQSFLNNSALCGEERFQVPPCPENAGRSKNFARLLKYIVPSFISVIILVVIIVIFIRRRKQKKMQSPVDLLSAVSRIEWRRISYIELERGTSSFSEASLLGRGGFGSVYQGILSDGLDVAVKVFNLDLEGATKSFDTESEILSSLRHRNLVRIIGCCVNIEFRALILAYMPNGNLEKWLHSDSCYLDLVQRLQVAIDVALALEYLHHGHTFVVVHCDIKPSNVLLDKDMVAHVGDFGISKLFDEGEAMVLTKTLATVGYAAPEYGSEGKVSTNGDVYSYGILLLEMFTQKKPTDDMFSGEMNLKEWVNEALQEDAIGEVVAPGLLSAEDRQFETTEQCVSSILDLAMKCVAFSPEERINMVEVVATLQKIKAKITVEEANHMRNR